MFLRILFIIRFKRLQLYWGKMSFLFEREKNGNFVLLQQFKILIEQERKKIHMINKGI